MHAPIHKYDCIKTGLKVLNRKETYINSNLNSALICIIQQADGKGHF